MSRPSIAVCVPTFIIGILVSFMYFAPLALFVITLWQESAER
nr:MAG TPA: hypothetical protein [Caudoviricetes sp.]